MALFFATHFKFCDDTIYSNLSLSNYHNIQMWYLHMPSTKCDVYDTSHFVVIRILHILQEACKLVSTTVCQSIMQNVDFSIHDTINISHDNAHLVVKYWQSHWEE